MSADPQAYWNIVSDKASSDAFNKEQPFRRPLISIESHEIPKLDIVAYARENRQAFLELLEVLTPERKQMAIEYVLLRKTEQQIAIIHGRKSQSMLGQELKAIVRILGATLVLGRRPSLETLQQIFVKENVPELYCRAVASYAQAGNLSEASRLLGLKRSEIRGMMREAHAKLSQSSNLKSLACAEYIRGLLSQWNCCHGPKQRAFRDSNVVGTFEVDISHPKARTRFTARAGQVSNASKI